MRIFHFLKRIAVGVSKHFRRESHLTVDAREASCSIATERPSAERSCFKDWLLGGPKIDNLELPPRDATPWRS